MSRTKEFWGAIRFLTAEEGGIDKDLGSIGWFEAPAYVVDSPRNVGVDLEELFLFSVRVCPGAKDESSRWQEAAVRVLVPEAPGTEEVVPGCQLAICNGPREAARMKIDSVVDGPGCIRF